MKKIIHFIVVFVLFTQTALAQVTGRQLDTIGAPIAATTVASAPNPDEVFLVRPVIGLFWDDRCTQVSFTLNSSIAVNANAGIDISPEVAAQTIQNGLDRWNDNPSSYIEMNVDNITPLGERTRVGGDFINEIVFSVPDGFPSVASSVSTPLLRNATFAAGEDFDRDGDPDVYDPEVAGINICTDIDGDGDIEFPAGDYRAGTIIDNDVQFDGDVVFGLEPSDSPDVDLDNLAVHEFGHAHGLSHSMINQISADDASGSTMYAFTDRTDGEVERATRTLHADDLAASAFLYPEGKATTPSSELQAGDIAFEEAYSLLTGNVTSGDGTPILNAAVSAFNNRGERVAQTYTGGSTAVLFQNSRGIPLAFAESVTANSGRYAVPVLNGSLYTAGIEAVDGFPLGPRNVSIAAQIASDTSNTSFPEETSDFFESANETLDERARPVFASSRRSPQPLDFIVNDELQLTNAQSLDFPFNNAVIGATDLLYAEMFDREMVLQALANGQVFTGGTFATFTLFGNRSSISDFSSARLALGTIDQTTGNVSITRTVDADNEFVAQEDELSPYDFARPISASLDLAFSLLANPDLQVFLVVEANDIVPNRNNIPNALIGESRVGAGTSFLSINGGALAPSPFNGTFNIVLRSTLDTNSRIPGFIERVANINARVSARENRARPR